MPMLCSPGSTLTDVPVNLAVIWSNPRAVRPFSGQVTWNALTGGWCDVCSVRYDTRIGFLSGVEAPCLGTDKETLDSFLSPLAVDFKLRNDPLSEPDTDPEADPGPVSSAVSILGALSSVSQLHCNQSLDISEALSSSAPELYMLGMPSDGRHSTHPKEFPQTRVVWLARFALCIFQILREPKADHLEHAIKRIAGGPDGYEGVRCIEICPILEIRRWLQELRRKGKPNGCQIRHTDESVSIRSVYCADLEAS